MSLFAFLGGRHDKRAWARALFAAGCRVPAKPDVKKYEKLTEEAIANDCRVICSSARSVMNAKTPAVRSKRKMIMLSRCRHLAALEPYATHQQKQRIREARAIAAKAKRLR